MKQYLFVFSILLFFGSSELFAQSNQQEIIPLDVKYTTKDELGEIYDTAELLPAFPGGEQAMFKYLGDHLKYPKFSKKNGIQGTVYVYFVIDKQGRVRSAEIKRGPKDGEELNVEALRVIQEMPAWTPGSINGKPVNVQFTLPITFKL